VSPPAHQPQESNSVPPGWKFVRVGVCCELAATVCGVVKYFNASWCIVCLCLGVQLSFVSIVPKMSMLNLLICWQVWIHSDHVLYVRMPRAFWKAMRKVVDFSEWWRKSMELPHVWLGVSGW